MIDREARLIALGAMRRKGLLHKLPRDAKARRKTLDTIVKRNPKIMEMARRNIALREYGITLD